MGEFLDLSKFSKQSFINEGSFGEVYKVLEKETVKIIAAIINKHQERNWYHVATKSPIDSQIHRLQSYRF